MADHRSVLPGFFDSLGVTFLAGRNFDTSDEVSGRKVVIIDDSLAKQLWPNDDAIGKALRIERTGARYVFKKILYAQCHSRACPGRTAALNV